MKRKGFTIRGGPLGLSLVAAAVTAAAFAAISLADNGGSGGSGDDNGPRMFRSHVPGPGAGPGVMMFGGDLSEADKQKLEEFRQCMEENGAPKPPDPGEFDPENPPKPPSAADREKLHQAFEACKAKLPEDLQKAGPPGLHIEGCAPPPGAPAPNEGGQRQNQSDSSGSSSGGTS